MDHTFESARIRYQECPICTSKDLARIRDGDCRHHALYNPTIPSLIRWLQCSSCEHVFTDGYFSEPALATIFSQSHLSQTLEPQDWHFRRAQSARMIEKVVSVLGGVHGKWLDVGFGNGCLLTTAKEFGFDVSGLDPRIQAVDSLRESGLEAHALTIDAFESDDTFSVV